jgi:glycosyltransferase involved in cell wall biosynthesis
MHASSKQRFIVMLSTSAMTQGGIAAVINNYIQAGLFERWPIIHVATHCDGSRMRKLLAAISALVSFFWYLCSRRILIVHVHCASKASFWRKSVFILMSFVARIPVIFHLHGGGFIDFYHRKRGVIRRWLIRFVLDKSSEIVVLSEKWRRSVSQMTGNPNVTTIANPVTVNSSLCDGDYRRAENVVLFLGRIDKDKGIMDLVDAFAEITNSFPDTILRFAGQGDIEAIKRRASDKNVLNNIEFLGWVNGSAKIRALAEATIYVLPSYMEGLPMGVLEAMAAGLPVVASNVGGIPEIVKNEVTGLLITPGDINRLTSAMRILLSDSSLRVRMGDAARKRIEEHYMPQRIVPQLEKLYAKLGAVPKATNRPTH